MKMKIEIWLVSFTLSITAGIVMEAHSPLGRPAKSAQSGKPVILKDPTIEKVANKHGATLAQVTVV